MQLYVAEIWKSGSGVYRCSCVVGLARNSSNWLHPVRMLGITPAGYVHMMVTIYKAKVSYTDDYKMMFFTWEKEEDARKYKNFINAQARKTKYMV